jgi:hypothetical protein
MNVKHAVAIWEDVLQEGGPTLADHLVWIDEKAGVAGYSAPPDVSFEQFTESGFPGVLEIAGPAQSHLIEQFRRKNLTGLGKRVLRMLLNDQLSLHPIVREAELDLEMYRRVQLRAQSLIGFIWHSFFEAVELGLVPARCAQCRRRFLVTVRKQKAMKFCSEYCRKRSHQLGKA